MSVDKAKIAARYGFPAIFGERLRGDTQAEVEADALALASLRDADPPGPSGHEGTLLDIRNASQGKHDELIRLLHGGPNDHDQ